MAFEKASVNPVGFGVTALPKNNPYAEYVGSRVAGENLMTGQSTGNGWAFNPFTDLAELVTGGASNPSPIYQDEIMRIANGQQPHPEQFLATDRRDGSEWFAGAMNLVGAMVDRSMGAPSEVSNPLSAQPVFFGSGQQSSGLDAKTLALFAGGAVLIYMLAKAA